ncbi:SGNH/GDSL hydrolase family protein [Novosphingobium sp. BL-52-GroH]|uniref:SGNH/GDSL hydrolase family protein n=1 Tax=Novosphingobium sp. BL-52-GroH TaxID=3349877 RepID=UPI00384A51D1
MKICAALAAFAGVVVGSTITSAQAAPGDGWVGAWGYATSPATRSVADTLPAGTYRYRIRSSQSGDALRLVLTNPDGAQPLQIASMSVARATNDGFAIDPAQSRPVIFADGPSLTLPGGGTLQTQPVPLNVRAGEDIVVTIDTSAPSTTVAGNAGFPVAFAAGAVDAAGATLVPVKLRPLVSQLAVHNDAATCTIVTFGDSITEGARGTRTDWRGWPGVLARRLMEAGSGAHCGVVNMGISGNRLLRDGRGTAGIDRLERDVASVPGVTHLIVLEGVNDIWRATLPGETPIAAADLIAGYRKLIAFGHARGIRVIGGTITPGSGWKAYDAGMEQIRQDVNVWIRTSGEFDAVVDFDTALRDTSTPPMLKHAFDSGDHLHPGNGGYEAMGRAVPLSLFRAGR